MQNVNETGYKKRGRPRKKNTLRQQFDTAELPLEQPEVDLLGYPIQKKKNLKETEAQSKQETETQLLSSDIDMNEMQIDLEELLADQHIHVVDSDQDLWGPHFEGKIEISKTFSVPEADIVANPDPEMSQKEDISEGKHKSKPKDKKIVQKKVKRSANIKKTGNSVMRQAHYLKMEEATAQDHSLQLHKNSLMIPDISDLFSDESRYIGRSLFLHSLSEWWRSRGTQILPVPQSWDDFLPPEKDKALDIDAPTLWSHYFILKWHNWEKYPDYLYQGQKIQSLWTDLACVAPFVEAQISDMNLSLMPKEWTQGQQIFYHTIKELCESARTSFLPVSKTAKMAPYPFALCVMLLPFGLETEKTADHVLGVLHYRQLINDHN